MSEAALRWKLERGHAHRVMQGVYVLGAEPPTALERSIALVVATGGAATGELAACLYELDGVRHPKPRATVPLSNRSERKGVRRLDLPPGSIVTIKGIACTPGL